MTSAVRTPIRATPGPIRPHPDRAGRLVTCCSCFPPSADAGEPPLENAMTSALPTDHAGLAVLPWTTALTASGEPWLVELRSCTAENP